MTLSRTKIQRDLVQKERSSANVANAEHS